MPSAEVITVPAHWRRSADPGNGVLVTARCPVAGRSGVVALIRLEVQPVTGSLPRWREEDLRATAALSGIPSRRVGEVLAEVGLEPAANKRAGTFSLGMRQRLALASALLGEPEVLLLDEPSNGLDPDGIRWLRDHLTAFARRGGTVFVSSHLISELSMFADDLVVIGAGRLLAAESVAAITGRNDVAVRVETLQPVELEALLAAHGLAVESAADRLLVHGTTRDHVSQLAFDNGIRLLELSETSRSLEDSLLDMTRSTAEFAST